MTDASPNLGSVLIVLGFLGALLVLRQIVVSRAGAIKARLGVPAGHIQTLETQRLGKGAQLSLVDVAGTRIAVVHGARGPAAMLHLGAASGAEADTAMEGHADAP